MGRSASSEIVRSVSEKSSYHYLYFPDMFEETDRYHQVYDVKSNLTCIGRWLPPEKSLQWQAVGKAENQIMDTYIWGDKSVEPKMFFATFCYAILLVISNSEYKLSGSGTLNCYATVFICSKNLSIKCIMYR